MMVGCHPDASVDILYPADPDSRLPEGAALVACDGIAWTGSSLTITETGTPEVRPRVELARALLRYTAGAA